MRIRQSLLSAFERCQRRGWYAMHAAANQPRKGVLRGADIHALLDGRFRGQPQPRDTDIQSVRVADALAAMVPSDWRYLGSEIPFEVEAPGFEIEGTLDALFLAPWTSHTPFGSTAPHHLVLCDRKTLAVLPGKERRKEGIRGLGPQPYFYGWAVCSEFMVTGLHVAYHFARRNPASAQPSEPIKTLPIEGWLDLEECRAYLESKAGVVFEMERVRRLPVFRTEANTDACFDYGGCAYRHQCAHGPKKDFDAPKVSQ